MDGWADRLLDIARRMPRDELRVMQVAATERVREVDDPWLADCLHGIAVACAEALAERRAADRQFEMVMCEGMGVTVLGIDAAAA